MQSKKNILFFSPDTFGLYKLIKSALEAQGYNVTWHNNLPSTNTLIRTAFRIMPRTMQRLSRFYFSDKIDWSITYENIIVIKGEGLDLATVRRLRSRYPAAIMTIYNWDSIKNNKSFTDKIPYFNKAFTFDFIDAEIIPELNYLPLFYLEAKTSDIQHKNPPKYSAAFIGTLHSNRYELITSISKHLEELTGKPTFYFFFYPSKFVYFILSLFLKRYKLASKDINFKALTADQIQNISDNAEIIIDIVHPNQSGLTLRTLAAIGDNKKLITNNSHIRKSDLFSKNNIFVIENNNFQALEDFAKLEYIPLNKKKYESLKLSNWIKNFL